MSTEDIHSLEILKTYEPFFGYWEIDELIGQGQYGRVYKIKRNNLNKTEYSAMKWIPLPTNDNELAWMEQEAQRDIVSVSARLEKCASDMENEIKLLKELRRSKHVVGYEDHIVHKRSNRIGYDIFIKMELLTPLTARLKETFTMDDAIQLGIDICKGLIECREINIIHRDIKPENMFIDSKNRYRLGDFGVAKQLDESMCSSIRGTPLYMAPEVYRGEKYDYTADIYSLALVLYTLLNHYRVPFASTTSRVLSKKEKDEAFAKRIDNCKGKRNKIPPPLNGFRQFNRILDKALSYEPSRRYQSAEDMYRELLALKKVPHPEVLSFTAVGSEPSPAPEPRPKPKPEPEPKPEPKPEPRPKPKPKPKPEPRPKPKPEPRPKPKPKPKPEPKPEPRPKPKPQPVPNKKQELEQQRIAQLMAKRRQALVTLLLMLLMLLIVMAIILVNIL